MEDDNSMSERILRAIESILTNDSELKQFSIIPAESNTKNKSPVLHEEHNIGLESWCVKHIYRYAYLELFEVRKLLTKRKLSYCKERNLNHLLIGVLLINPDVSTFWNMRRELVELDVLSVGSELLFTKIVLSYKSKSNEAFAYRRWLLQRVLAKLDANDLLTPQNLLRDELEVCEMAAENNSNNYHAWTHRIWCMERLGVRVANISDVVITEMQFGDQWVMKHVSEHTGFHYLQYIYNRVHSVRNVSSQLEFYYDRVVHELRLGNYGDPKDLLTLLLGREKSNGKSPEQTANTSNFLCLLLYDLYNVLDLLILVCPDHESAYYHRRYLVYQLMKTAHDYHGLCFANEGQIADFSNIVNVDSSGLSDGEKKPKLFKSQPNKVQSTVLYKLLIRHETDFIRKSMSSFHVGTRYYGDDAVKGYQKWLKCVLCIDDI